MTIKQKTWIAAVCAVLLTVTAVFNTLAYLTDTEEVINTFTVGQVHITLDETAVNPNGTPIDGADRVKTNEYHLIPGREYVKDPTVTVMKGSEESYVRMLVTVNCYSTLQTFCDGEFLPQYFVEGWDSTVWSSTRTVAVDNAADTATYEFRYVTAVKPDDSDLVLEALFDTLAVPEAFTAEQLKSLESLEITVVAHAIQKAGFDTADMAWAAFDAQIAS